MSALQMRSRFVGWCPPSWKRKLAINLAAELPNDRVEEKLGGYVKMTAVERAKAVKNLTDENYSSREIADIVGVSHVTVASDVKNLTAHKKPLDAVAALAIDNPNVAKERFCAL